MTHNQQDPTLELAAMTTVEFEARASDLRIALLPIGATEQHGPNLTMDTDFRSAYEVAMRIAGRLQPHAVVLPTLPYGSSDHHMGFPGTVSLSPETILVLLRDIAASVKRHGLTSLVLVNGHNGNTGILNVAANKLRYEFDLKTAVMFYFQQAADVVRKHAQTDRYGHACEIETSVMMAVAPDCVRENLVPGDIIEHDRQFADNRSPFALQVPIPFADQTSNGVFGDARLARPEIGHEIIETAVDRAEAFARSYLLE